jgi:hypothetical protein
MEMQEKKLKVVEKKVKRDESEKIFENYENLKGKEREKFLERKEIP